MDFDYTIATNKSFEEAVEAVQKEIEEAGMRLLYVHDVQKTLGEKGFQREPFKIIEFCSAKYASAFLDADIKIGLCMPCKINVYIQDGPSSAKASAGKQTFISGMRPIILPQFFPEADLGEKPREIDQIIQNIINKSSN
jgi:uncharacterized protein (DUF302 family)